MTNERAIEHIRGIKNYLTAGNPIWNTDVIEEACGMAIKALEEPERETGRWMWMGEHGDSRFMCSVCKSKENVPTIMGKPIVWEYCPSCGAKMEGESE